MSSTKTEIKWFFWIPLFLLITSLILFGTLYAWLWYGWQDHTVRRPLANSSEWPEAIQLLHSKMKASGMDVGSAQVYLLHDHPDNDLKTAIYHLSDSEKAIDFLKSELQLQPIPPNEQDWMMRSAFDHAPKDWWAFSEADADYFASLRKLSGEEGDLYVLASSRNQGKIFIL